MDGKKVIDRQNMPNTYNDFAYHYLKFGLYKWKWGTATSKRVMYFDDPKVMIPAYDDYSWVQEFATEESFELVSNIKREGVSAGRFQLNKNDPDIGYSKRVEMSQRKEIVQPEGWYGFSNFFPSSYTADPIPEIVAQWHDLPDIGEETDRSNSNSIMIQNDNLIWQVRSDTRFLMPNNIPEGLLNIVIGKVPKNKWIDWVVHIKYSYTNTGILEVWMDGVKVIDRQNMPNSYNDKAYPFFKFGVYKWEWGTATSQRVIYMMKLSLVVLSAIKTMQFILVVSLEKLVTNSYIIL